MVICLIYPRTIGLDFFPLGIGYIASSLESDGHKVHLLDIAKEDKYLNLLHEIKPDLIGISITTPSSELAKNFISDIRKFMPNVPLVCGGIHPSVLKEDFLKETGCDFLVYGEGEDTIKQLCMCLQSANKDFSGIRGLIYNKDGFFLRNQQRELIADLDKIPFPSRHKVNFKNYLLPPGVVRGVWLERSTNIITSRGCFGECIYCSSNYLFERKIRRRSVGNVVAEIELLANNYNIDGLFIMDDTFLIDRKWIAEFSEVFKKKKFGIKWSCYGRADTVSKEMFKMIKDAGCIQVEFGVESGSDRVLSYIKKGMTINDIKRVFSLAKGSGLRTLGMFMMGFPTETKEEVEETIRKAKEINPDFATCYYATPYPGSEFYEYVRKNGLITDNDYSNWYVRNVGIWKADLPWSQLVKLHVKFLKTFRVKNTYFFIKNYRFLFRLLVLVLSDPSACVSAFKDVIFKYKCFDEFLYSFLAHRRKNVVNKIQEQNK